MKLTKVIIENTSTAFALSWLLVALPVGAQNYTSGDFASTPAFISDSTDPFVMIDLSVELTQQAEAYTDGEQEYFGGTECGGRNKSIVVGGDTWGDLGVGVCYSPKEKYIGYFDPTKCYVYDTSGGNVTFEQTPVEIAKSASPHYFRPNSSVSNAEGDDYSCGGNEWSGHLLNWATMTALDQFRSVMTGGARIVDEQGAANARTLLTRAHRYGSWQMATKGISELGFSDGTNTYATDLDSVMPSSVVGGNDRIFFGNGGSEENHRDNQLANTVDIYGSNGALIGSYNVIVGVCDASKGLEENCKAYTDGTNTWYKPEGKIQQNAQKMRFALMTYSAEPGNSRNGGVLRSNAKYLGYYKPSESGGIVLNDRAEIDEDGTFVFHPDENFLTDPDEDTSTTDGEDMDGVANSGVINYINQFGLGPSKRYKANDPFSELYYESLRYFMNAGRTLAYADGLNENDKDGFPVITENWEDPILSSCQANYIVAVGDQFMHRDGDIPTANSNAHSDDGGAVQKMLDAAGADTMDLPGDWDVDLWTDRIGAMEKSTLGELGSMLAQTGDGNEPSTTRGQRFNTFYVAGMAYYARTQDIRDGEFADAVNIKTFIVDTQEFSENPPTTYQNPLWMAAKYGGFDEIEGSTKYGGAFADPNDGTQGASTDEWDADGGGVPDTYTLASQPQNLKAGLDNAFNDIAKGLRASSAAGVISNTASGEALVVQALYKTEQSTDDGDRIEWLGIVQSLFVDSFNNIREDSDLNNRLTTDDNIIVFNTNAAGDEVTVDRYETTDNGETLGAILATGVDLEDVATIWNARDELAKVADYTTQRAYRQPASSGRYIFTAIDENKNGISTSDEAVEFSVSTFSNASADPNNTNFRLLGLDSAAGDTAEDIVNFIRGDETIAGFRSRSIKLDADGADVPWLLGDVVNSSPIVVGRPSSEEDYSAIYGDDSYAEFAQLYRDRRQVVYFGANDGMLHAVNAGFYDVANNSYSARNGNGNGSYAEHPLGSEIWAYVPTNVLPHLRWLTELSYPHVYYVDGIPQSFDVNIFDPSSNTHKNGWGTILVVGLRLGGGEIMLDLDNDSSNDYTTRSSYIVLDITDPEQPPTLIAEITHPMMGYTTSRPTIVKSRVEDPDNGTWSNKGWWLVMGSGPIGDDEASRSRALDYAESNQTAKVFIYDLLDGNFETYGDQNDDYIELSSEINGFTGDFVAADWDDDFSDEAIYFGTVTGSAGNPGGSFYQLTFDDSGTPDEDWQLTDLLTDVDKPFSGLPHVKQVAGENWLFTGTGRFYVADDNLSEANPSNSYYGLLEPYSSNSTEAANLADVTNIDVQFSAGALNAAIFDPMGNTPSITINGGTPPNGQTFSPSTFAELKANIAEGPGWVANFGGSRERHVGRSDSTGVSLGYTSYVATNDSCDAFGDSFLNLVHFGTGTAAPFAATDRTSTRSYGQEVAEKRKEIGIGLVRDVSYDGTDRSVLQDGLGGLSVDEPLGPAATSGRVSWREIIIDWE